MILPGNKIICFQQDAKERKRFFKPASFAHPAKMVLGLQIYLIEHYTKPGDTILDPMAGSGTILMVCTLGRNVVLVELEDKFVKMQQDNWQKIKSLGPMLGYTMGKAAILQGDARNLSGLLADNILFSPPFASEQTTKSKKHTATYEKKYGYATNYDNNTNISNLPYGEISAVISSPPYEGSLETSTRNTKGGISAWDPKLGQTGTYGDLDPSVDRLRKHGRTDNKAGGPYGQSLAHPYSGAAENIGNLKSTDYLSAMLQVYRQCHRVLKKGGLLILVIKNFIHNKKIVRLDLDTIKLCEQAGFKPKESLKRKLTSQSFWRTIYHKKFPNVPKIEFEDILIFTKGWPDGTV